MVIPGLDKILRDNFRTKFTQGINLGFGHTPRTNAVTKPFFLGLKIKQIKDEIFINKFKYFKNLLKIFGVEKYQILGNSP